MTAGRVWALAALGALAAAGTLRAQADPRGYTVYTARQAPVVDGALDDAAWRAAPWTEAFVDIEGARRPAPRHLTRA